MRYTESELLHLDRLKNGLKVSSKVTGKILLKKDQDDFTLLCEGLDKNLLDRWEDVSKYQEELNKLT